MFVVLVTAISHKKPHFSLHCCLAAASDKESGGRKGLKTAKCIKVSTGQLGWISSLQVFSCSPELALPHTACAASNRVEMKKDHVAGLLNFCDQRSMRCCVPSYVLELGICGLALCDCWSGTGMVLLQNTASMRAGLLNSQCCLSEWGGTVQDWGSLTGSDSWHPAY